MEEISYLIQALRRDWSEPRPARHGTYSLPVLLRCSFNLPALTEELTHAELRNFPPPILNFWKTSNGAVLFEDVEYGQWGLSLYSAAAALKETALFEADRSEDFVHGDVVVGQFLGDSDRLLIRCDPSASDFGDVLIALPLDEREHWLRVASGLGAFLDMYTSSQGEKFWRRAQPTH